MEKEFESLSRTTSTPLSSSEVKLVFPEFSGNFSEKYSSTEWETEENVQSGGSTKDSGVESSLSCSGAVPKRILFRETDEDEEEHDTGYDDTVSFSSCSWSDRRRDYRDIYVPHPPPTSSFSSSSRYLSNLEPTPLLRSRCSIFGPKPFAGREYVDFLRLLDEINAVHVIRIIASYLDGPDMCSLGLVSRAWNQIVNTHCDLYIKRNQYLQSSKLDWENSGTEERNPRFTPRKAMNNVSNLLSVLSQQSPSYKRTQSSSLSHVSPSKIRHKLFTEEASKLGPGEQLQSCPRCTNPSRVIVSESRAICSRLSCGFQFCTRCMCEAHKVGEGHDELCRTPTKTHTKISNKSVVATKKSRRRLKRL